MPKEQEPVNRLTVRFGGTPGRTYTNNGLVITQDGGPIVITERSLPEGFPHSLDELAKQLRKIDGMEVKINA